MLASCSPRCASPFSSPLHSKTHSPYFPSRRHHHYLRRSQQDGADLEPQRMVPLDGMPGPLAMQPDVSATAALELRARSQEQALRQMAQHGNWPRRLAELAASATKLASYVMQELGSLRAWLGSCVDALPQIDWIPPGQAAWRTGLVLATSLLLIVVISTIDGVMLQLYLVGARRLA